MAEEENELVFHMSQVQEEFESKKNELISKNTNDLEGYLNEVNQLEEEISSKREEIKHSEVALDELVNHYQLIQQDENQKLNELKRALNEEFNSQNHEIEDSIAQLEISKEERINYLKTGYEISRRNYSNQLNAELLSIQNKIEDEKNRVLREQKELESRYALSLEENNRILNKIRDEIKETTLEFDREKQKYDDEITILQQEFEQRKKQLEEEAELSRENSIKQYNEFKNDLVAKANALELDKIQVKNSIDAKIKQQEKKKEVIDKFIEDYK